MQIVIRTLRVLAVALLGAATLAHAANVAVYSDEHAGAAQTALVNAGNTVTIVSEPQIAAGLGAYEALYMGHAYGLTPASCAAITNFVNGGGGLVTEWNNVYNVFSTPGANLYFGQGTQCALFAGTVGQGDLLATNTPVTFANPASPLAAGLTNPLQLGGGTEYFYLVTGFNPAEWTIVATYDGYSLTGNPAILTANIGAGKVAVGAFDYGDSLGSAQADRLLVNLVASVAGAQVPVAPAAIIAVPTLSQWVLAVLALTLGVVGVVAGRRRRIVA